MSGVRHGKRKSHKGAGLLNELHLRKTTHLPWKRWTEAAEIFMPLYRVVADQLPKATVEDVLKVMESVAKLGHKRRGDKSRREVYCVWI